ncbi:MAG: hypothetical protein ACUVQC_00435, partial [Thermaceae bacterium]
TTRDVRRLVDLEVLSPAPLGSLFLEGREGGQLKRFGGRLARGVVREEIPLGVEVSSGGGRSGRCDGTG